MVKRILTQRQLDVIGLLDSGKNAQEVADTLGISKRTVDMHLTILYRRLGVSNRISALKKVRELGLLAEEGIKA